MPDNKTREKRSENMAAIKGKDTKPEVYIRKLLFHNGYRYHKYSKSIPGHPDIWMRKYNTAIFVNGCFWHRHSGCKYAYMPKSRIDFWQKKFNDNIERDFRIRNELSSQGIRCIYIWECTVRKMKTLEDGTLLISRIKDFLAGDDLFIEL